MSCGSSTGPFSKGATNAPIDPLVGSTLPIVRSTSLTTIPGDAKFRGILLLSESQDITEIIYCLVCFHWGNGA